MLEVAVIGAGSAGLVAARQLLAQGLKCCILEASSVLGGSWATSTTASTRSSISSSTSTTSTSKMWQGLHTNLSKHTCCFSDLPWSDVQVDLDTTDSSSSVSTFPSHVDMEKYLQQYADTFIDPECFQYNCQVTNVTPLVEDVNNINNSNNPNKNPNSIPNGCSYRVEWTDTAKQTQHSKDFGGVIVTTGFFAQPTFPTGMEPSYCTDMDMETTTTTTTTNMPPIILHSQDYRNHQEYQDQTVAVIGASFSALEIAVDVSKSAKRVVHVLPHIPWIVPRMVPIQLKSEEEEGSSTTSTTAFVPIDLAFYRRTSPAALATPQTETIELTPAMCRQKHQQLQQLLGPRQQEILGNIGIPFDDVDFTKPPKVAISDYYLDLVADTGDDKMEVIHGRAMSVDTEQKGLVIVESRNSDQGSPSTTSTRIISNIDTVICCTGYQSNLDTFLDDSILKTLQYNAPTTTTTTTTTASHEDTTADTDTDTTTFAPLTACWETLHPDLPNFALVGMYRGSYMGVVELQAKLAAQVLSGKTILSKQQCDEQLDIARRIRQQPRSRRPQFPHFDYIGFMDSLASAVVSSSGDNGDDDGDGESDNSSPTLPIANRNVGDVVTPAFYQSNLKIVAAAQEEIAKEFERGKNGSRIPGIVLSALIGAWDFDRTIVHFSNKNHRESVTGTIRYSRRPQLDYVLYREDGLYHLSPTKSLPVFREYEYVCNGDMLEIYFVESGERAHLFLSLKFQPQQLEQQEKDNGYWVATSDHLCIQDLYKGTFHVKLDGLTATEIKITYRVKGPAKDYEATTFMTPQQHL